MSSPSPAVHGNGDPGRGAVVAPGRELATGLHGGARSKAEVERTLLEITTRAAANATGDVGVGLSVLADEEVLSIGATSESAQLMDHGQALDGDGPCLHALRFGEAVSVTDYTSDGRWPGTSSRAADAGVRSSVSLPLRTGALVLGALNVYSDSPEAFGVESLVSLGAFADQATTSLFLLGELQEQRDDNAYVNAFASTVQDSLRTVLPDVPGLELVGGSVPSAPHAAVGGDWYDALRLPDGSVGLIIGDVMGHDYREGVSIWFRGIFRFSPHPDLMAEAPLGFQLHGLVAMGLFALWPFTRLVHVFSAPLGYLTRPYIVYRSREDVQLGSHTPRRGWQRVDR